jgi:hypothetical protein
MDRAQLLAALAGAGTEPGEAVFVERRWEDYPRDLVPFVEDLLAEMESMCGGADRCRWSLDEPCPPRQ